MRWHEAVGTFFGAGKSSLVPGTAGSLAAIPLYLMLRGLTLSWYVPITVIITIIGTKAADMMEKELGGKDPSSVVIDEVVGMLITLAGRPKGVKEILAGFILFRIFDILKPPPVGTIDKEVDGGIGIMADDVAAGIISAACLKVLTVTRFIK